MENQLHSQPPKFEKQLTEFEADTLGEICNIFMGSASTTLSILLDNKVEITTPQIGEYNRIEDIYHIYTDVVTVEIYYTQRTWKEPQYLH